MPPKRALRARGKAKAAAKAGAALRRPAAALGQGPRRRARGGLRRPAEAPGREQETEVQLRELGIGELLRVGALRVTGRYWDAPVELCGLPKGFVERDEDHFLRFEAKGTKQEALLRYLSSTANREVLLHLCEDPCGKLLWKDGVIHVGQCFQVKGNEEDWMNNAVAVQPPPPPEPGPDDLALLREEQQRLAPGMGVKEKDPKEKKRKREDAKEIDLEEDQNRPASSKKVKVKGKKELTAVFGATGMDPNPSVRRRFRNKARRLNKKKKKKKQKKDRSSSGSSTGGTRDSSTTEGSLEEGAQPAELFGETSLARKIANKYPGVLCASWVREIQDHLMTAQGQLWSHIDGALPPLAMQNYRQVVSQRMSGAMGREYQTLSFLLDLAVQGRMAELCDVVVQRLKSLSSTQSGVHFTISQRMELLPVDRAIPASLQETQAAARAAEQEDRVLHRASKQYKPWGTPNMTEAGRGGKGKDGKGKKGKFKEGKKPEEGKGGQDSKKA